MVSVSTLEGAVMLRIIRFQDKNGKWHSYAAQIVNGKIIPEDLVKIKKIKEGK